MASKIHKYGIDEFQSAPRAAREANPPYDVLLRIEKMFQSAPRAAREANVLDVLGYTEIKGFNPRLALRARRTAAQLTT